MVRCVAMGLLLPACLALPLHATPATRTALADRPGYQLALAASRDGLHAVAALKYEKVLKERDLSPQEIETLGGRLVDAFVRARMPARALEALETYKVPEAAFWRGQALMQLQKHREAEGEFKNYLKQPGRYAQHAHMALGYAIIAQGRENAGRKELKELLDSADPLLASKAAVYSNESEAMSGRADIVLRRIGPERGSNETEFVRACSLIAEGDGRQAEIVLRRLLDNQDTLPLRLHDAAFVRLAEAYALQGRYAIAEKRLRAFINRGNDSEYAEQAFAILRSVSVDGDDDLLKSLLAWSAAPTPPGRQALALYHVGQWLVEHGRGDEAIGFFEAFRIQHPSHPRQGEALRALMALYGAARADDRVVELWRSRYGVAGAGIVDYLMGMVRFSRGEYASAVDHFSRSAGQSADVMQSRLAMYNAAVSAVMGGNNRQFRSCVAQLQEPVPPGADGQPAPPQVAAAAAEQSAKLLIERALSLAAKRDPKAEEGFQEFLQAYPRHPRAVEAYVALAELAMLSLPARTKAAGTALDTVEQIPNLSSAWQERLAYIRVWWHEAAGNPDGVVTAGTAFLDKWKESEWRDEVRMKVAQAHFRNEEYARAGAEFEALAEEHGDSPYAEVAIYFAGKAAMAQLTPAGLEKAIDLWAELVTRGSPLSISAQRQQALAKRRQGREDHALLLIETLLGSKPAPTGTYRYDLLMEKGELLVLLSRTNPKYLDDAAEVFRSVVEDVGASRAWRSRAGVLLAQCHQQAARPAAALEACFDVVEQGLAAQKGAGPALNPQESVWLFRAGFTAIELLESQKQWDASARLADRLAKVGGERSEEAAARAERIRLEHLIWEKSP